MMNHISAMLEKLEDRYTQIPILRKMNDKVLPALLTACGITGILAFIGVAGGLGTWDFYGEIGEIPPYSEEVGACITIGVSMLAFALSAILGAFFYRVMEWNEEMILWRKRVQRIAFEKELQRVIAEVLAENERAEREYYESILGESLLA